MNELVRWRLAPTGVEADVYLAHSARVRTQLQSLVAPDPVQTHPGFNADQSSIGHSQSGVHGHSRLKLDAHGLYKNRPVCILGREDHPMEITPNENEYFSLRFPRALEDLRYGLRRAETELVSMRMLYALGRGAWERRARWKTHHLHLIHNNRLLAVIEPSRWQVHLLTDSAVDDVESASVMLTPISSRFAAVGFERIALEPALWEFAKRCPEDTLSDVLPSTFLRAPLAHRRVPLLSERELGDHCVAILRALDTRSRTADELQISLRFSRPALLRALACLALTRAIRNERPAGTWWSTLRAWWPGAAKNTID